MASVTHSPYNMGPSGKPPTAAKSVSFIPMSPKSSETMEMHRRQQELSASGQASPDHDYESDEDWRVARPRRSSDTTHDRPRVPASDEDVEDLPDRFDSHGVPLDRRSASHHRWTSRSGAFHRQPQAPGDWNVRGAWHVGGTNNEAVERLAHGVTDALEGRGSWMNVIGEVLGGGALGSHEGRVGGERRGELEDGQEDEDERRRGRRRRY